MKNFTRIASAVCLLGQIGCDGSSSGSQTASPQTDGAQFQNSGFDSAIDVEERNGYRYVRSTGVPDHETGEFPNQYDPVAISEQDLEFRMTLSPQQNTESVVSTGYEFGVAVNGVVFDPNGPFYIHEDELRAIVNPFDGIDSGWQYEGLSDSVELGHDQNDAHVQPPGLYHYHGVPRLLIERLQSEQARAMVLVGYAADGFPIYNDQGYSDPQDLESAIVTLYSSYSLRQGERPANPAELPTGPSGTFDGTFVQDYEYIERLGDLDECNGRFGVTAEFPEGKYHYVITTNWPYLPRCFKGSPDESFVIAGPG